MNSGGRRKLPAFLFGCEPGMCERINAIAPDQKGVKAAWKQQRKGGVENVEPAGIGTKRR